MTWVAEEEEKDEKKEQEQEEVAKQDEDDEDSEFEGDENLVKDTGVKLIMQSDVVAPKKAQASMSSSTRLRGGEGRGEARRWGRGADKALEAEEEEQEGRGPHDSHHSLHERPE